MANILDLFKKEEKVSILLNDVLSNNKYNYLVNVLTVNQNYLLASLIYEKSKKTVVFVEANQYKANIAYDNFCQIIGYENVSLYSYEDIITSELITSSNELKLERLNTINNIINNQSKVIITHVSALLKPIVEKERFIKSIAKVKKGDIIPLNSLVSKLIIMGYRKVPTTTLTGEFSVRGGVVDIFPNFSNKPVRLSFFDDEIEEIKEFDIESQKSVGKIEEINIFPFNEFLFDIDEINEAEDKIIKKFSSVPNIIYKDFDDFKDYNNMERISKYLNYFKVGTNNILSYIEDKIIIYDDYSRLNEANETINIDLGNYLDNSSLSSHLDLVYYLDFSYIFNKAYKALFLSETKKSLPNIKLDGIYSLNGYLVLNYQNDVKLMLNDIKFNSDKTYILCASNEERLKLIYEIFNTAKVATVIIDNFALVKQRSINLIVSDNALGYASYDSGIVVLTEKEIFKNVKFKKTKYRSAYQNSQTITSKDDIVPGDYVVHYDYGIGKYLGIKTIELGNTINDYLMLKYENMDLYIPVEKINLLDKYQGTEGSVPHLNKIGNKEWEKKKAKIREKISDIAKDLIMIQAKREVIRGHQFQKDTDFQEMFEADFEYEETLDQIKAVEEIKEDMEKGLVIDRLICGDVGYGKTEIAMRIAFKTVYEGMQVAYLAPTTILTRQHFQTFKARFDKYGIKVELLNRLVSLKKREQIIENLHKGLVDIVIGTHSLLSDSIKYKNLGLLIVDEEQRFGVVHKEKIKKLKENVNVLTLTATPIPRTLQMSMTGVRQLSLIATPPANRYPIQTFVLEENPLVIKEAIYREINRGGQVFYLHNRVDELDIVYEKISKLTPEAKVTLIHGQMTKERVEDTIQSFIDGEYNVLICTTIIETGIDIPNTNTLIISNADRLGLSQLYQIRGRVGRSDRVAYAYLMYKQDKILTDVASQRLNAIKEFTNLGNGYKIAVRDLAIRGAGDILGKEQSGFIDTIGLDMYLKMLNEEIAKAKGEKKEEELINRPIIEVSKHVDSSYVTDDDIIILIHKEINSIKTKEEKEKVIEEFTDRFGKLNDTILLYIEKTYLDSLLEKFKITNVLEATFQVTVSFSKEETAKLNIPKVMEICYKTSENIFIEHRNNQLVIKVRKQANTKDWIYLLTSVLSKI